MYAMIKEGGDREETLIGKVANFALGGIPQERPKVGKKRPRITTEIV